MPADKGTRKARNGTAVPMEPTESDLAALFEDLKNWGRWGPDDERGALNHLTARGRQAAVRCATDGSVVSLAHDLPLQPSVEARSPSHHHMLTAGDARDNTGLPGYEATRDYIGTDVHGLGITHVDALCHLMVQGAMYNGIPAAEVRSDGAKRNTVMTIAEGIVGRGVLLDVPGVRGVPFLDGGEMVHRRDLEDAETREGVHVEAGDILLVSTGRDERRAAHGGVLDPADGFAGLHPDCLGWLHDRGVAVLGSDGISDPMPGLQVPNWPYPIHQIGITAIGLHLVDNLALSSLTVLCGGRGAWAFLFMLAPLRVPGATGCPVNPLAVL